MAITKVQDIAAGTSASGTTIVLTLGVGVNPAAGNLLVVRCDSKSTTTSGFTCVDSRSNTWTQQIEQANSTSAQLVVWSLVQPSGGTQLVAGDTITLGNYSSGSRKAAVGEELTGAASDGAVDQKASGTGTGTSTTSGATANTAGATGGYGAIGFQDRSVTVTQGGTPGTFGALTDQSAGSGTSNVQISGGLNTDIAAATAVTYSPTISAVAYACAIVCFSQPSTALSPPPLPLVVDTAVARASNY